MHGSIMFVFHARYGPGHPSRHTISMVFTESRHSRYVLSPALSPHTPSALQGLTNGGGISDFPDCPESAFE